MPYIDQNKRDNLIYEGRVPEDAGELNYLLTIILDEYLEENGGRYQQINDIIGALEASKLEFYRRLVVPFEETKIQDNGDVYLSQTGEALAE